MMSAVAIAGGIVVGVRVARVALRQRRMHLLLTRVGASTRSGPPLTPPPFESVLRRAQ